MFGPRTSIFTARAAVRWTSSSTASVPAPKSAPKNAKFLSPDQLLAQKKVQQAAENEYKNELLAAEFQYAPQVLLKEALNDTTGRPVPLNVELLQYRPIRLPKTHGHEVALITLTGYDRKTLDSAAEFAARAAFYLGIPCGGITNLRVKEQLYTVIRSPFAQAKLKENFKRFTYGRKMVAFDADPEVVDVWLTFLNKHKHEGVAYKANVFVREGLDFASELEKISGEDLELSAAYGEVDDPVSLKVKELLQSKEFKKYFDE